jgi:Kef-type K+ transport system membrane component KefB/mannitol/fructose-specific phosphotransferase system IIA component (Ntr-type)
LHAETATLFLVAVGVLLTAAKVCGLAAQRLHQPTVVGEIAAGVLLGPTLFGRLAPDLQPSLFPSAGDQALLLDGVNLLGIVVFLFMAGAEIDVAGVSRRAKQAVAVAGGGMLVPMVMGGAVGWLAPAALGWEGRQERWLFALFIGTALCISALPVIAKTLLDLGVYRSDLGMTVMAAAVINDVLGWVLFAFILGNLSHDAASPGLLGGLVVMTVAVVLWALGRPVVHHVLAFVHRRTKDPAAALAVMIPLMFAGAAVTEHFGVHAMFGAFVVGATAAGSPHLREQTRRALQDFVSVLFAPLFFASIGLRVDFVANFDVGVVLLVIGIACAGKILGCGLSARAVGIARREAWAIGFAMNARGAMEIVLALVARRAELIGERTFVALVTMALATSMLSGPVIRRLFPKRTRLRLADVFRPGCFVPDLSGQSPDAAIRALATVVARPSAVDPDVLATAAIAREHLVSTALGGGVAAPHARLEEMAAPAIAIGVAPAGLPFDAPDGAPVRVVVLIVTPASDNGAQLELLADLAQIFSAPGVVQALVDDPSEATLLDLLRAPSASTPAPPPAPAPA